jgi:predicted TIM-barrel fold metal-dependent hydrolase
MVVFDAVVHAFDYRERTMTNDDARDVKHVQRDYMGLTARRGPPVAYGALDEPPTPAWARRVLFEESDTDLAMVQTVPLFNGFPDGMGPARLAYDLARADPARFLFCGGVDPLHHGLPGALAEMERQVREWGAVSMKFYQAQTMRAWWHLDDRAVAYPLFEKAQALGIKLVQFHKGLPLGWQRVESLRPNDLQLAAYDFPDLTFGVHHFGEPYVDELINIASRFENIVLVMPLWFNQYFVQPRAMLHRLGEILLRVGEDRVCYGSEAFLWPHVQSYIDLLAGLELPEELQEQYGYPAITPATRRKIFGENFARALGIDLPSRLGRLTSAHGERAAAAAQAGAAA